MFNSKQQKLFSSTTVIIKKEGAFVTAGMKKSVEVESTNGAIKYSSTGNPFVDQFGKTSDYKTPRTFADISADCEKLWASNPHVHCA